jgi:hemerythrin superfamily protein
MAKTVIGLFDDFSEAQSVTQICHALTVHAQVDEEIFYPALKELRSQEMHGLVAEAAPEDQAA